MYQYNFENSGGGYDTPLDPVNMRWVVNDALSQQTGGTAVVEFTRTILWQCYSDQLSVSAGGHTDYTYNIGATAVTQASTETQTYTDCALTYACEMYDTSKETWVAASDPPINTCDNTGVTYEVTTGEAASFQPSLTELYRVVYTSTHSTHTNRIAYDEFELTVRDDCYNS